MEINRKTLDVNVIINNKCDGILPFKQIEDTEIEKALSTDYVVNNVSRVNDLFESTNMNTYHYDLLMLTTIVKNISDEFLEDNYNLIIWDDDIGNFDYTLKYLDMYYLRAYYYCQREIPIVHRRNS